jgi:hypothetical protein
VTPLKKMKNKLYSTLIDVLNNLIVSLTRERFPKLEVNFDNSDQANAEGSRGIVLTTFEKRFFSSALPLIQQLRDAGIEHPIIVLINGNLDGNHDQDLRRKFISELAKFKNLGVVTNFRFSGISRHWNLGIQLLGTESVACLSDDLVVSRHFKNELESVFDAVKVAGLVTIEGFAAFAITRELIDEIGWFDERFLGFGEEDADYVWRYIKRFKKDPPRFKSFSLIHQSLQSRGDEVAGISKYSLFNLTWRETKYVENSEGISGLFDRPQIQRISDMDYHPMETFRRKNRKLLSEVKKDTILNELSNQYDFDTSTF